ncbi:MAG: S8 family peptidase [Candidatus Manganitrophaceae bacterium]
MKAGVKIIHALFILLLVPAIAFPASPKIDPKLTLMVQKGNRQETARRQGLLKPNPAGGEPLVGTILRFQGDLTGVEKLGGRVESIIGDIATVDIPLNAVELVSKLPNVVYIEAPRRMRPRLDVSVPATRADTLRGGTPPNWTGRTGKNVVIGIIDSGIDWCHGDFIDDTGSQPQSRVLFLWDQDLTPQSGESAPDVGGDGNPANDYGVEYTASQMTAALADCNLAPESRKVRSADTEGHGTHVAGIAAGNGSATGNSQPPFRYVGMAPEADLIIVKSEAFTSADILNGISYIQARAAEMGKPSVINLSLGSDLGPHDGTGSYERGLDNASGVGKVIVGAAGNEGDVDIHASGTVSQGGSTPVGLSVPADSEEEMLDFWYAGADKTGVSVNFPGKGDCTTPVINPGDPKFLKETTCGRIEILSSGVDPLNGDREIFIVLSSMQNAPIDGEWRVTLSGTVITNGRFDGWVEFKGDPAKNIEFTDPTQIDRSMTLTDTGTATRPISVGAYNTKNRWNSLGGAAVPAVPITLGNIASFSSRGPRRTCSDTPQCPSIQKPEIAAPGSFIMSAFSSETLPIPNPLSRDPDGVHVVNSGTSMAAPHVTGAVALLLEAAPTLTWDQVKALLTGSAKADSFTATAPNNTWGFGKLDVKAASEATPPPPGPVPNPGGSGGGSGGGGCFIATAAYGSFLDPHVQTLRKFRDDVLLQSAWGSTLVDFYYAWSPGAARFISQRPMMRGITRFALLPIVFALEKPNLFLLMMAALLLSGVFIFRHLRGNSR